MTKEEVNLDNSLNLVLIGQLLSITMRIKKIKSIKTNRVKSRTRTPYKGPSLGQISWFPEKQRTKNIIFCI